MNIIAVDDEYHALEMLKEAIEEVMPEAIVKTFEEPEDALRFAAQNRVNVAFLDIEMREMTGLELAKKLKDLYGQTNIIFVTGFNQYARDALTLYPSGYLTKPVSAEDIAREMENLRFTPPSEVTKVRIRCFGSFGVFVNGEPLLFSRGKAKELLALLVHHRGAALNTSEIAAVLWEGRANDKSAKSNTRNVIAQLTRILKEAGIAHILLKARNCIAIDVNRVSCDYYDYLEGNVNAVKAYLGEYMTEYSWAEFTAAYLSGENKTK